MLPTKKETQAMYDGGDQAEAWFNDNVEHVCEFKGESVYKYNGSLYYGDSDEVAWNEDTWEYYGMELDHDDLIELVIELAKGGK